MLAVYNFEDGNQHALLVLNVDEDTYSAFLRAVEKAGYPIPLSDTEIIFIENDKLISQIEAE